MGLDRQAELPDEMTVRDWKTSLVKYSMAKAEPEDCISVHALVQAVERHAIAGRSPEAAAGSARRVAGLFSRVTPWPSWDLASRALWEKLASHAETLAANGYVEDELRGTVLAKLAEASRYAGDYATGVERARRALEARERVLGREHPDTLTSVNNLAALLKSKGDYDAAEPLYRRALEARERVLGREHPDTLTSVNNLALLLYSKGDYDAAEPLYRRALEAQERVLGREHPDTLTSVNNLAVLLYSKGDYDAAEPLYRRALEARSACWAANIPIRSSRSTIWRYCSRAKVTTTRPSRSTAARWRPGARAGPRTSRYAHLGEQSGGTAREQR